jgi:hypothetical protein
LRFIVAPLLPRLPRSVDGEIRAKNFRGNGKYESPAGAAGLSHLERFTRHTACNQCTIELVGVLEWRTRLQAFLCSAGQNQFFVNELELRNGTGDTVCPQA